MRTLINVVTSALRHVLVPPRPAHGLPIRLEFKCGDYIINRRPPVMDRTWLADAYRQARDTNCPNCSRQMWAGFRRDFSLLALRTALLDAWGQS